MTRKETSSAGAKKGPFRIIVEKNIVGEFTLEIEQRFKTAIVEAKEPVVLDLTAVSVVDSYGIALCVGLFKECQKKDLPFSIETSPELFRFFKLLKLDRVIRFTEKGSAS